MKIHILKSKKNKQWYFRIVADNGKKISHSEGYKKKVDCLKTVTLLKAYLVRAAVIEGKK